MMTPIMHDSPEWRDVQKSLHDLQSGQVRLEGKVDGLAATQKWQHSANQKGIEEVQTAVFGNREVPDTDNPGIKVQVDRIETYSKAIEKALKIIAWIMGIGIAGATFYVSYLESHHRIGETHAPSAYVQQLPTDATATPTAP